MTVFPRRLLHGFSTQIALVVATTLIFFIDKSLRYKGYRWTSRWLILTSPTPHLAIEDLRTARKTAYLIDRAALRSEATCLRRSLALWWWLRWKRIPSDIYIGVNATDGHAWVVHHGIVVNDRPDVATRYIILDPLRLSPVQIARL